MREKFTLEEIREFWTEQAGRHGPSPAASWSDFPMLEMEVRQILRYVDDGDRVLDAGCANGHATLRIASERKVSIRGLDYAPGMIEQARQRLATMGGGPIGDVQFDVGDILSLGDPDRSYDKVVVVRVLINLGEWEHQSRALQECARVLRPSGLLLLSEATLQGWMRLNAFRREWGLPDIPMPPFNEYLDEERLLAGAAAAGLELVEIANFASSYYVGTRVLKPLLAEALGNRVDVADPNMEWNRFWSEVAPAGDYGTQKLFVFRKR